MTTSQNNNFGVISITDYTKLDDGSIKVSYALDEEAMKRCAEYTSKPIESLSESDIHTFVVKNLGAALKGQDGWETKKVVE